MKKYYIVSGGFDPIHEGHIAMIRASAAESDGVILLLNSDDWLTRKKGTNFMTFQTRKIICENLKGVLEVIAFDDADNSASDGIRLAREKYPDAELVFANGGDRTKENIPETAMCEKCRVVMKFGVGGENKANASSKILKEYVEKIAKALVKIGVTDAMVVYGTDCLDEISASAETKVAEVRGCLLYTSPSPRDA